MRTWLLDAQLADRLDVQELAGRASLSTTRRYIQSDTDAKRKVVDM